MIKWWQKHTTLRQARELVKGTRKVLRMQRDILDPHDVQAVGAAADAVDGAVATKNAGAVPGLVDKLEHQLQKVFPQQKFATLRENVEVFLVAAIVAMGVRTFFFQPFKIPTGSMQPTLYGIFPPEQYPPEPFQDGRPSPLSMLFGTAIQGKMYSGGGYRQRGDHIFVDRFTYHFRKPHRGEVIVFDTSDILLLPEASRGKFYIKRLIGLGGDRIQIQPPYVKVNGQILDGRPAFKRIYSRQDGYNGYVLPQPGYPAGEAIRSMLDIYTVPDKHLFVLGDNSVSSLDGRFWGSLPDQALVGRAVVVYWPFTKRFGLVD
jgi:signal peptidase I